APCNSTARRAGLMSEVFLVETGQLTPQSRRELKTAGIVVAEVAGITRCQFLRASEIISADDMLWAVLDALNLKSRLWKFGRETARETRRESFEHRQHKPRGRTAMT